MKGVGKRAIETPKANVGNINAHNRAPPAVSDPKDGTSEILRTPSLMVDDHCLMQNPNVDAVHMQIFR